jgi:ribosomal protein L11 methyltransferase
MAIQPCEELVIDCPADISAYVCDCLWGLSGVLSVTEDYRDEVPYAVRAIVGDPGAVEALAAYLQADTLLAGKCTIAERRTVHEEDWAESWKQFWHVQPITQRLTICPSWETYTPSRPDEVVIELDPGCAFGTGTHETTRLMLQGIEQLAQEQPLSSVSILDVGTGSGVLAIYAAKLGCRTVMALDSDPVAVRAAQENVAINGVSDAVTVSETPLDSLCHTRYDIVLANIIAPVILELLDEMVLRLEPGGTLLLSGLIESSIGRVEAALQVAGLDSLQTTRQGDWYALRGTRRP